MPLWRERWTRRLRVPAQATFPAARFPRTDQFLAERRSAAHGIARLPGQIAEASVPGLTAAQTVRSRNMADLIGKPLRFGFHKSGNCVHQIVEPRAALGLIEKIESAFDPQWIEWREKCARELGAIGRSPVLAKFRAQLFHDRFGAPGISSPQTSSRSVSSSLRFIGVNRSGKIADPIDLLHRTQFSRFNSVRPVAPARVSAMMTICKHRSKHNPREITGVHCVVNVFAVRKTTEIASLIATFLAMRARLAPIRKQQRHLWFAKGV